MGIVSMRVPTLIIVVFWRREYMEMPLRTDTGGLVSICVFI